MPKKGLSTLAVGRWEIDRTYGLEALARYADDVQLIQSGATTAKELYTARRTNEFVTVMQPSESDLLGSSALSDAVEQGSIAHFRWSGVMMMDGGLCSRGIREFSDDLRLAADNTNIAGILLEMDSGGGQSTAGHELMNTLADIQGTKPVVVYTQMLASAALRGTLTASAIYAASRSTIVGSIGTYISIDEEDMEMLEKSIDIYADQSTMKNAGERALKSGDDKPMREFVSMIAQGFIDDVQEHRLLRGTAEQVGEVLAGKTLTADDALERGLIDGIATFGQALEHLNTIISNQSASVSRGAEYSTNSTMKFTELITLLKEKMGLEVATEGSYDDIITALEGSPSLETVREQITAKANEQTGAINASIEKLTASIKEQAGVIEQIKTDNAETVKGLQRELAEIKGSRLDEASGKVNDAAPNPSKFKTVNDFKKGTGIKSEF